MTENLIERIENLPRYEYGGGDWGMDMEPDGTYCRVADVVEVVTGAVVAHNRDAARLEWVVRHGGMLRVQGSDERGWCVLDCRNGLTFLVDGRGAANSHTFRDVIDIAMEKLP